ncbi:MAG TPA: Nif11-like leader peptide family natural product precursor [Acidimicrobiales bacterium]|jgi:predicted ribosomally synthesized peptide with nif11-like leader
MSAEGATAFFERMNSDEQFRNQLEAAETPEEKRRIVTDAGYDVDTDDLPTIRRLTGMSELSDKDVEKVAGGLSITPGGAPGLYDPKWADLITWLGS